MNTVKTDRIARLFSSYAAANRSEREAMRQKMVAQLGEADGLEVMTALCTLEMLSEYHDFWGDNYEGEDDGPKNLTTADLLEMDGEMVCAECLDGVMCIVHVLTDENGRKYFCLIDSEGNEFDPFESCVEDPADDEPLNIYSV